MARRRYRWRTRIRRRSPWWLLERGLAAKGRTDCGEHEWYNADEGLANCYHCTVGVRPFDPQLVDHLRDEH